MRSRTRLLHIASYPRISGKVFLNVMRSHTTLDAEILRQTEGAHAVDQSEVNHLGHSALLGRHVFRLRTEHFGSRGAMNVFTFSESLEKSFVL